MRQMHKQETPVILIKISIRIIRKSGLGTINILFKQHLSDKSQEYSDFLVLILAVI